MLEVSLGMLGLEVSVRKVLYAVRKLEIVVRKLASCGEEKLKGENLLTLILHPRGLQWRSCWKW
jgi:hypothetical protein